MRLLWICIAAGFAHAAPQRPVTVMDMINMTEIGNPWDAILSKEPATFAPDGRHFVVVTHHGNVAANGNDYSLWLFDTDEVGRANTPRLVDAVTTQSNDPGISEQRWLDNSSVAFLASEGDKPTVLRSVNIVSGGKTQVVTASTDVVGYDMTPDQRVVAYATRGPVTSPYSDESDRDGLVISNQFVGNLYSGQVWDNGDGDTLPIKLQIQSGGSWSQLEVTPKYRPLLSPISLSPDGRRVIVWAWLDKDLLPPQWLQYKSAVGPGVYPLAALLLDRNTGSCQLLFDAPVAWPKANRPDFVWTSNSTVVVFDTWLPTDALVSGQDPEARYTLEFDAMGHVISRIATGSQQLIHWDQKSQTLVMRTPTVTSDVTHAASAAMVQPQTAYRKRAVRWQRVAPPVHSKTENVRVYVDQGYNQPPTLVAQRSSGPKITLLDPNPQFKDLQFGHVSEISFSDANGSRSVGGIYLPPDHRPAQKHPLVIQTHGWLTSQFSIDGMSAAGYAAQALAGRGFVVAQLQDHDEWEGGPDEGARYAAMYEGLIGELNARGLINKDRVGILAWSRTGFGVRYTLAFSKQKYAAAALVDSLDISYGAYLAFSGANATTRQFDEALGGGAPFGPGLRSWIDRSPGFHLDQITAPVRLVTFLSPGLLENWEWFTGLRRLGKPVEYLWLRKAAHSPVRPSERYAAQEGNVDWFDFWINGREDLDPTKANQYKRWRALRQSQ